MIGDNIRKIRELKGLSINALAKMSKMSAGYLSDIEKNNKTNPTIELLEKIAKALGVQVEDFYKKDVDNIENESTPTILDLTKDVTDVEEAMKVILSQPGLLLNGNLLSDEDKIKVANAILMGLRFAAEQIEKEKKSK